MLLEYEQSMVQGRCISLVSAKCSNTLDLLFDTAEHRNVMLNVLDLCLEWRREEARLIWDSFSPSEADAKLAQSCGSYEDVKVKCGHLLPLVDALHTSFIQFVKKRDDRLDAVCFDFEPVPQAAVRSTSQSSLRSTLQLDAASQSASQSSLQPMPQVSQQVSQQVSSQTSSQVSQQVSSQTSPQTSPQPTLQASLQACMPGALKETLEFLRPHAQPHPPVLKVFVKIAEALARVKAHLEKGVFRIPGPKEKVSVLKQKVRNVGAHGGREL